MPKKTIELKPQRKQLTNDHLFRVIPSQTIPHISLLATVF